MKSRVTLKRPQMPGLTSSPSELPELLLTGSSAARARHPGAGAGCGRIRSQNIPIPPAVTMQQGCGRGHRAPPEQNPVLTLQCHCSDGDSCAGSRLCAKYEAFRLVSWLQGLASPDLKCKIHPATEMQNPSRSGRMGM